MQQSFPNLLELQHLPENMPCDSAISIGLEEGIPIFQASSCVITRIQELLNKEQSLGLNKAETEELDHYEAIDDSLSYLNRLVRNMNKV